VNGASGSRDGYYLGQVNRDRSSGDLMAGLRSLPSVDKLLQIEDVQNWILLYGRALTVEAVRICLDQVRERFKTDKSIPRLDELLIQIQNRLELWTRPTLIPVINASGVILHTNLGRAPLSREAIQAAHAVAAGYSNLEYDLEKGQRGSRLVHVEALLVRLTGADAGLVVNNNAAAVLLALTVLARRRGVVIARSQLVEIGGGFRIPDVMKQSGARLIEVGATNRVHLSDYEQALTEKPALFLRAHRSNFKIIGFTSEPTLEEMASIAHRAGIMLVDDLGSGSLLDTREFGLAHEPMVQESLHAGVDLVCFSGDKLLGGPQAGILLGRADLVEKLKKHPLARAIRADKLALATLTATLVHYLKGEAVNEIPIWRMIAASKDELVSRTLRWIDQLQSRGISARAESGESTVGGGSLPGEMLPTYLLSLAPGNSERFVHCLRHANPPIIARVQEDQVFFDPRTVLFEQENALLEGICWAWRTCQTQITQINPR
jgi:L-seryl-tRNA(Ser) seleniumtransferase